jgi:hypothetical protein
MKQLLSLVASGLLLAGTAQAQAAFHLGPYLGGNVSTAHFADNTTSLAHRGFEAGILGAFQFGHLAVQPAVLFAQRGFTSKASFYDTGFGGLTQTSVRLHYLTIPLQVAYTQHTDGQGFQVSAGPYVSFLLGGKSVADYQYLNYGFIQQESIVAAADVHTTDNSSSSLQKPDYTFYSRRLDVGAQAGLGYRLGGALLQVSYSLGLRNVATVERYTVRGGWPTYDVGNPAYRNRAFQASLTYLFGIGS